MFHGIEVTGIFQGYEGLIEGDLKRLHARSVAKILGRGGTILKSARSKRFYDSEGRAEAAKVIREAKIDGLVVIGGNGTFTRGHEARRRARRESGGHSRYDRQRFGRHRLHHWI